MAVTVEELAGVPVFRALSVPELEALAGRGEHVAVAAGTDLAREGDFGHSLFVVMGGTAEVKIDGTVVSTLTAGDAFGEIAVVASGRRTASVTSTTPMTLVSFFKREIWELEKQNPAFSEALRALTAGRSD